MQRRVFVPYTTTSVAGGWALLGFGLRDSAGGAPKARGGAYEGRHARGWGHPNPWRQRLRATPSGNELSRITCSPSRLARKMCRMSRMTSATLYSPVRSAAGGILGARRPQVGVT